MWDNREWTWLGSHDDQKKIKRFCVGTREYKVNYKIGMAKSTEIQRNRKYRKYIDI